MAQCQVFGSVMTYQGIFLKYSCCGAKPLRELRSSRPRRASRNRSGCDTRRIGDIDAPTDVSPWDRTKRTRAQNLGRPRARARRPPAAGSRAHIRRLGITCVCDTMPRRAWHAMPRWTAPPTWRRVAPHAGLVALRTACGRLCFSGWRGQRRAPRAARGVGGSRTRAHFQRRRAELRPKRCARSAASRRQQP